jgi:hypothetical protein
MEVSWVHRINSCKTLEGGAKILATPERVLVSQHRPDAEGLLPGRVLVSYQDPLHSERG